MFVCIYTLKCYIVEKLKKYSRRCSMYMYILYVYIHYTIEIHTQTFLFSSPHSIHFAICEHTSVHIQHNITAYYIGILYLRYICTHVEAFLFTRRIHVCVGCFFSIFIFVYNRLFSLRIYRIEQKKHAMNWRVYNIKCYVNASCAGRCHHIYVLYVNWVRISTTKFVCICACIQL